MCGRYTHLFTWKQLHRLMELASWPIDELDERYNVAPTQFAPVVRVSGTAGRREGAMLRWGLVPSWAKDPAIAARLINARAETIAQKPAFRHALRRSRCLVPISGFFEWRQSDPHTRKQPFYIHPAEPGDIFALAALWERWSSPDAAPMETFTLITTVPNSLMLPLHDRMPVILPSESWSAWLDPACTDPQVLQPLLRPCDPAGMRAYPVSTLVNSPKHDSPACIQRSQSQGLMF
jgi:putative SOS response-associated peptidase YedK